MVRSWLLGMLVVLPLLSASAEEAAPVADDPGPGARALTDVLRPLDSLHARFTQHLFDAQGRMLRQSDGELWAARPERFRWETSAPFAETLVGDGRTIWLYDPDLEQVTIRPFDERLSATPARILSGDVDEIVAGFDVELVDSSGVAQAFTLWPTDADALFERLELVFIDGLPDTMTIHDQLGQRTEIVLADVRVDFDAEPYLFSFIVPEGVDVIRDDG